MASTAVWERFLTEQDREVYALAGYGTRSGPGKRPAVLVVDANYNFLGYEPKPIAESVAELRTACGLVGWQAVPAIETLLAAARAADVPVIYSTGAPRPAGGLHAWARKNHRAAVEDPAGSATATNRPDGNDFPPAIAPAPGELVIRKEKPSPFFGSPLASYIVGLGVDTLLIVGGTTSGCVRAAVVDAFSYNLRVLVVEDGCFDRGEASHALNLFDMHQKYADVIDLEDALRYLSGLQEEHSHD
jgi:nicotinamidase-related amidase